MNLVEVKYKKFTFHLKHPLQISNRLITHKDVIILKAKDSKGKFHFGEVSPLEGFSGESIADCESELNLLIQNNKLTLDTDSIKKDIVPQLKYHSLKYGIEQILLSIDFHETKMNFQSDTQIKINALVGIQSLEDSIHQIDQFLVAGFETIKIKTGIENFDDTIKILNHYKQNDDKLKFRLDNNASWDSETTLRKIDLLEYLNVEYLEQPVVNLDDLKSLNKDSIIPVAPDESLTNFEVAKKIIEEQGFHFLILKPSIRIGIYDSIKLIELANSKKVNVIITSAFETAIGRSALLFLASLVEHNHAHGLNTELLGQEDILSQTNYGNPVIYPPTEIFNYKINSDFQ